MVFPITVLHTNRTPQITDISNITLNPGVVQDIPVKVVDPDNYPLTLQVKGQSGYDIPNFATFTDNFDGTGILHLAPTDNDGGNYTITLTATDNSRFAHFFGS